MENLSSIIKYDQKKKKKTTLTKDDVFSLKRMTDNRWQFDFDTVRQNQQQMEINLFIMQTERVK